MFSNKIWKIQTSKIIDKNKHGTGRILEGPTFGRLNIKMDKSDPLDKQIMRDDLNSEHYAHNEKG